MPKPWELQYESDAVQPIGVKPWEVDYGAAPLLTEKQQTTNSREAFGLGISGGQIPFANRITSGATAAVLSPFLRQKGEPITDAIGRLYTEAQDYTKRAAEEHPTATLLGNLSGVATTLPTAFSSAPMVTGALSGAGKVVKSAADTAAKVASYSPFKGSGIAAGAGNLASKMVGSAAVAAPVTGAYFAGEAEPGQMGAEFGKGALIGGAVGLASPVAGLALRKTSEAFTKKPSAYTSEEIRQIGSALYKQAEQKGGILAPSVMDDFINEVSKKSPQTKLGKALEGESPVSKMISALQDFKGQPLTLDAATEADQILGDLAYANVDSFGKIDSNGKKFLDLQTALRRKIEDASESAIIGGNEGFEAVKDARRFWATQLRMRDIERIINNAEMYEQPSTAIRTGFRTIMKSDRFARYTPEEQRLIKRAAATGVVENALRYAGSGLVPIAAGSAGLATGGLAGAAAAIPALAVQQAAKKAAEAVRYSKANNVSREIMKRIPEAKGKTAEELIGLINSGAKIGKEALSDLPLEERKKALRYIMKMPTAQAMSILNNN